MCNVAPDVLLQYRSKGVDDGETLDEVSRDLYEECKRCHKEHTVFLALLD
jgi:hypothetical protein